MNCVLHVGTSKSVNNKGPLQQQFIDSNNNKIIPLLPIFSNFLYLDLLSKSYPRPLLFCLVILKLYIIQDYNLIIELFSSSISSKYSFIHILKRIHCTSLFLKTSLDIREEKLIYIIGDR